MSYRNSQALTQAINQSMSVKDSLKALAVDDLNQSDASRLSSSRISMILTVLRRAVVIKYNNDGHLSIKSISQIKSIKSIIVFIISSIVVVFITSL
jgi:hypothetical protein